MDFMSTVKGSLLDGFYPEGWDMAKIDACCEKGVSRESFWNESFTPIECGTIEEFDTYMGHEIALRIKEARDKGERLALILPVGPMGMYRWASFFLNEWNVKCDHVYTFNMDEWSDGEGNTLPNTNPASFEYSMKEAFSTSSAKTPFRRRSATLQQRKIFRHIPKKLQSLRLRALSLCLCTESEECATSHSGNRISQLIFHRLRNGRSSRID